MTDPIDSVLDAFNDLSALSDPRVVAAACGIAGSERLRAQRRKAARLLVDSIRRAIASPNGPR